MLKLQPKVNHAEVFQDIRSLSKMLFADFVDILSQKTKAHEQIHYTLK